MDRYRNKWMLFAICITVFLGIPHYMTVHARNSEVKISIEESSTANLFYQVVRKKKELIDDIPFVIRDQRGNTIYQGKTEDSLLYVEDIPFGTYEIIFDENVRFEIHINKEYVKEQHILKTLELHRQAKVKTGDAAGNRTTLYSSMLMLLVVLFVLYRKRVRRDE